MKKRLYLFIIKSRTCIVNKPGSITVNLLSYIKSFCYLVSYMFYNSCTGVLKQVLKITKFIPSAKQTKYV